MWKGGRLVKLVWFLYVRYFYKVVQIVITSRSIAYVQDLHSVMLCGLSLGHWFSGCSLSAVVKELSDSDTTI